MLNVTILACLLILTGCFGFFGDDDVIEDAEGENTPGDSGSEEEETWYSAGGTFKQYWNEDGYDEWGDAEDGGSDHGSFADWDTSECTEQGGVATPNVGSESWAPECYLEFKTITSNSGQAIVLYELETAEIKTTCNGSTSYITSTPSVLGGVHSPYVSSTDRFVLPGSAMNCQHVLGVGIGYYDDDRVSIWSVVYEIRDVTVV